MTEEQIQAAIVATNSDQSAAIEFTQNLLRAWMRRNTIEGMNVAQSLWVFARFEKFTITLNGVEEPVDMFKMFQSGAIPTVYYCLLRITPDAMDMPHHWVTQVRLDWIKTKIEEFIGPQMTAYLQSLP